MIQFLQQPIFILAGAAVLIAAVLFWLIIDLRLKWTRLFGKKAPPDGKLLKELIEHIVKNEARLNGFEPRIDVLERISQVSVQKTGFMRFNPFSDTGGDQSFSLALLDREDNGIVVSSLYTREGTRVYAKEIRDGKQKQPLSNEEQKVLEEALHKNL